MFLRRFKVGHRAIVSFSIVALLVVLLGVFAKSQMQVIRGATLTMQDNTLPSYRALAGSASRCCACASCRFVSMWTASPTNSRPV